MLKPISLWIRIALLLMLAAVAAMCIFWMPTAVDYASDFLGGASRPVLYALGGMIALVMAVVLILAFRLPWAIDADCIFHARTAGLLKGIAALLGGDCLLFGGVAVALLTAATIFALTASISVSVSVFSRGWSVTATATDFWPSGTPLPS